MNIIRYPERAKWSDLLKRSALHTEDIRRHTPCRKGNHRQSTRGRRPCHLRIRREV